MTRTQKVNLDHIGFWASALCALHCAALPILLTFSTLGGLQFLENPLIEGSMLIIAAILALASIFPSYFKKHHKLLPIILVIVGFGFIGWSRITNMEILEAVNTVIGGLVIAVAHLVNASFLKRYTD